MSIEIARLRAVYEADTRSLEAGNTRAEKSLKDFENTTSRVSARYTDAQGRMREANGRFVTSAESSSKSARSLENSLNSTTGATNRLSKSISSFVGNFGANAIQAFAGQVKSLAAESFNLNKTFDRTVRFTSTLDEAFQTPESLKQLKKDFQDIAPITGQAAEDIAKASFTIKSAYQNLTAVDLKAFLTEFGLAATGSNAKIDEHSAKVVALAKQYNIGAKDLRSFSAMVASSFGQALGSDSQVAEGFNRLIVTAQLAKVPLNDLIAAMSTIQSTSSDAAGNTTNLQNAIAKLGDAKYIEGLKEVFNIDRFNKADGSIKSLNQIVNELAKSLTGLTDEQKLTKLNSVFKDLQANQGMVSLVNGVKEYNKQLQSGSDAEAFQKKVDVMLGSTEARWNAFYSNVENRQREFGANITESLLSIFNQQTVGSQIEAFFLNIGFGVIKGWTGVKEFFSKGYIGIANVLSENIFGGDATAGAKRQQDIDNYFQGLYVDIENTRARVFDNLKQDQIKYFKDILASPLADESLKTSAKKSLEGLGAGYQEGFKQVTNNINQSGTTLKDSLSKLVENTALSKGLREKIKAEIKTIGDGAKQGIDSVKTTLNAGSKDLANALQKLLGDTRISGGLKEKIKEELNALNQSLKQALPQAQTSGKQTGNSYIQNVIDSISKGQPIVFGEQKKLIVPETVNSFGAGFKTGTNVWLGVVQGINSGRNRVTEAAQNLAALGVIRPMNDQFIIKSPSRVMYEMGSMVVQGFVNGITDNTSKVANALKKAITTQIKDLKKELQESNLNLQAFIGGYGQTAGMREKLAENQNFQSTLDSLLSTRRELNINVGNALPSLFKDAKAELDSLNELKESTSDLTQVMKELGVIETPSIFDKLNKFFTDNRLAKNVAELASSLGLSAIGLRALASQNAAKGIETPEGVLTRGRSDSGTGISGFAGNDAVDVDGSEAPKLKALWEDFFGTLNSGFEKLRTSIPPVRQLLGETLLDIPFRAGDAIGRALQDWDGSFKGFFKSVALSFADLMRDIAASIMRVLIVKGITSVLGNLLGGIGGGLSRGHELGHFGGFRADGGMVTAGTSYIVGERGTEMFVPSVDGYVMNNSDTKKLLNKQGTVINNNITVKAGRDSALSTPKSQRQLVDQMVSAIERRNR